ncbi:hypothetical protein FDP41_004992 [Naegleria fowleri]|uniref:Uncharacterized protein n=1 Tax=Naegleria fowleri TaxID=5763 RepID=A0A6A5BQF0_NAEFO|nr:uncharacterized protein FDP41_004992 [Naegleria fowleri]KAF0975665.1 hypothetical protein FDP41_004992 [Naegleria fowleri]
MWQTWSSRITAKNSHNNNNNTKSSTKSALAPTGVKAPSPKNPLFFESQQHQILKNALSTRQHPINNTSSKRNIHQQRPQLPSRYNNDGDDNDDDDDEEDIVFNPQFANFISLEKDNSQKDFYDDDNEDKALQPSSTSNNLVLDKTSPLNSQEKDIIEHFSNKIIANSQQISSIKIGDRMVDENEDEDNDKRHHNNTRRSSPMISSKALFTPPSKKSSQNKKSSSTSKLITDDDDNSSDSLSINDDDFEKYFGSSPSLNSSSSTKKKKTSSASSKRRKKTTKQLPDKISGIYHSDEDEIDQDVESLNEIMNFDNEDSQPRVVNTTENDSSSSTATESTNSYSNEFSQPLTPPERTYKATKKKQTSQASVKSKSSLNTSKYFTPHSSTAQTSSAKRKSAAATLTGLSYHLPKEIEDEDDIGDFSDEENVTMGGSSNGAFFSNLPQHSSLNSSTMQQHVHNNNKLSTITATSKSKSLINVDDLIASDSDNEEETTEETTTSSEMDQRFSQMVAAAHTPLSQQPVQTTPARTSSVVTSSASKNTSTSKKTNTDNVHKDIILSGEDGFDLDERLKGIRRKSVRQSIHENEVERLLFSNNNRQRRGSSSLENTDDMIEDENPTTATSVISHPSQSGTSWLDNIRKSSKQPQQHVSSSAQGISLSQQSNQGNNDQFFSQWDHLKKILSTRSQGRFVSKLKRAINGGMNEKVFQRFSSEINLSQQPVKEGLVLKILTFNQAASQVYPHLVIGICKILSRPHSSDNERLDQVLYENDFIDVYFAKEMKEKWNLRLGSVVEISTLFHITPPQDLSNLGQPSQYNEPIFIYRPRPVLSYFFEMKCKSQTSDMNELAQDIKALQTKFNYPMLSSSLPSHNDVQQRSMMVENEQDGSVSSLPSTPPRSSSKSRTNTPPDFLTPSHVRQRNAIATPKRLDFSGDNQDTSSTFERNYHLISRIATGPLTKKFESVYKYLHSSFFPSYYLNIEGVIQRVWSFDFIKHAVVTNHKTVSIPQLTSDEAQLSNTVLIQCVSTKSLCILLLPSGDTEYSYWRSIFDYNISQGKVVQFNVCSFKDRVYIGPEDELYSIIAPMYHHNQQQQGIMTDPQHSQRSTCSESSSTNPLIPLYFFTTNSQHSTCKYVIPNNYSIHHNAGGIIQPSYCDSEPSSLLLDPLLENISPYSSYRHQLFYSFEQPISGDTQQSNGGVEDVMIIDEDNERGGKLRMHRCDIEGTVLFIKETDQVPWSETQNSLIQNEHENTLFTLYLLQKHSSMILKLDSIVPTGSSVLYSIAKSIQTNSEIILHNVLVRRHSTEKEAIHTELILDKFSILYLPKDDNTDATSSAGEGNYNTTKILDLTQTLLPYCVKPRGMDQQKKHIHRMNDSTAVKALEYEYTCTKNSIGLVEGYVTEILEEPNRGPTISLCPHCHQSLQDHHDFPNWRETEEGHRMCMQCFTTFTKPQFELYFRVKVGSNVVLTLDTLAIQQMFAYKQTTKQNKKLPVSGNETYKQARDLVLNHHLRFLCHCDAVVENGSDPKSVHEEKTISPCYHFSIVHGVRV